MPFPSHEQELVINHRGSPLIVVAGPGTGKPRTLVERMIQLLQEDHSREVSFVTFTRTSMRDTEKKLVRSLGEEILEVINIKFPRVSTLHTYAKSIHHRLAVYCTSGLCGIALPPDRLCVQTHPGLEQPD